MLLNESVAFIDNEFIGLIMRKGIAPKRKVSICKGTERSNFQDSFKVIVCKPSCILVRHLWVHLAQNISPFGGLL